MWLPFFVPYAKINTMTNIDFKQKLNINRPYGEQSAEQTWQAIEYALESDRGRIINAPSLRRLQQKTQVFPLERNAEVRSRLTHSLEVQQNGRYLVQTVFKKLNDKAGRYGLAGGQQAVTSLVEMACLMHDIGNPPFGHFGEQVISQWFSDYLSEACHWPESRTSQELKTTLQRDLSHFEGNAQAIRLTARLERMNLSYAQTAAILKYSRSNADEPTEALNYLHKKPGFYVSEQGFVADMWQAVSVKPGHRFPLTYLMEAADDIAYCLADIEDAVEKGIMPLDYLIELILNAFQKLGGDPDKAFLGQQSDQLHSLQAVLDKAYRDSQKVAINSNQSFFIKIRVPIIHYLVNHAAQQFVEHIESIYHGDFNQALLEDGSQAHRLLKTFKQVGYDHVYCHNEVQKLELQGQQIISGILDHNAPLLSLAFDDFQALLKPGKLSAQRLLINRMDPNHLKAYQLAMQDVESNHELWDFYHRCRLLQDHISAMTDHSAYDEYRLLKVSD